MQKKIENNKTMTNTEIKTQIEEQYKIIENARFKIANLRDRCKHEESYEGTYSPRDGQYFPATICSFCNEPIKIHHTVADTTIQE